MIMYELAKYYDRISESDDVIYSKVPQFGFKIEKFDFCITIDLEGNYVNTEDIRVEVTRGKKSKLESRHLLEIKNVLKHLRSKFSSFYLKLKIHH